MLEILENLFYNKKREVSSENIVLLNPYFKIKFMKILLNFKQSFSSNVKNFCFLIDGAKINSKNSLHFLLTKIYKIPKKKKGKCPFSIVIVINIKNILIENQLMFKKFLTERTMEIKFLFLVDDLRWLNEIILTECSIIPCKNKFVKTTPLFLKKRCLFQYSKSLIKSWLKKTLSLKNNFYTNLSATQSNNKPYISRLKAHLFKFSKVYCNEAFVFFISTFFFTKEKNERMELSSVIFKNCECYIKKFEFYRLFSVVD